MHAHIPPAPTKEEYGQVSQTIDSLWETINYLQDNVKFLESRLSICLAYEMPVTSEAGSKLAPVSPTVSGLHQKLADMNCSLVEVNTKLRSLKERVTL